MLNDSHSAFERDTDDFDLFEFSMEELARCIPTRAATTEGELFIEGNRHTNGDTKPDLDNFPMRRSVKFESEDEEATRRAPLVIGAPTTRRPSKGPSGRRSMIPAALRPLAERRVHAPSTDWNTGIFIAVSPREELSLARLDDTSSDLVDIVAVRNTSDRPILFKIKTTSPEKFRVRPSAGKVAAGSTETVRVYLQNEYRATAGKEKFLLMALQTEATNVEEFGELWTNAHQECKWEHKLRCRVLDEDSSSSGSGVNTRERRNTSTGAHNEEVIQLREEVANLSSMQKMIILAVAFLVILQLVFISNERSNSASLRLAIETLAVKGQTTQDL